jgi:hypothetical protein
MLRTASEILRPIGIEGSSVVMKRLPIRGLLSCYSTHGDVSKLSYFENSCSGIKRLHVETSAHETKTTPFDDEDAHEIISDIETTHDHYWPAPDLSARMANELYSCF